MKRLLKSYILIMQSNFRKVKNKEMPNLIIVARLIL